MDLKIDKNSPLPIYHQLSAQLRDMIKGGELKPGDRLPAEMDISKSLGISPMTARQAYTRLVEDGLLQRFHGKGTFVGPRPKGVDYGVLLFNLRAMLPEGAPSQTFGTELILGLESACARRGANLHLLSANGRSLGDANNAVMEELLAKRRMDGLILAGTPLGKDDIDKLVALGTPLASIDGDYGRQEIPAVLPDDQAFSELAVRRLASRGLTRLLLATGPLHFGEGPGAMRRRGARLRDAFFATLAQLGLESQDCRHLECEQDTLKCETILRATLSARPPQAIITDGDTVASGAAQAISALGMDIPILNFADSPQSPFPFAVKPIAAMTEAAVALLADVKNSGVRIIPVKPAPDAG